MMIAMGIAAVVAACLASRSAARRNSRVDRMGLYSYEHKARCEGSFPFDYLSR
jgi:hypothetical protein